LIEILKRQEDEYASNLTKNIDTTKAKMVNRPPVVEVSSWSVCIFLKKSNDFNIVDIIIINV
jgi:hypothetical protein